MYDVLLHMVVDAFVVGTEVVAVVVVGVENDDGDYFEDYDCSGDIEGTKESTRSIVNLVTKYLQKNKMD